MIYTQVVAPSCGSYKYQVLVTPFEENLDEKIQSKQKIFPFTFSDENPFYLFRPKFHMQPCNFVSGHKGLASTFHFRCFFFLLCDGEYVPSQQYIQMGDTLAYTYSSTNQIEFSLQVVHFYITKNFVKHFIARLNT